MKSDKPLCETSDHIIIDEETRKKVDEFIASVEKQHKAQTGEYEFLKDLLLPIFNKLKKANLLNDKNCSTVFSQVNGLRYLRDTNHWLKAIELLESKGILNQEVFDKVIDSYGDPESLAKLFILFEGMNISEKDYYRKHNITCAPGNFLTVLLVLECAGILNETNIKKVSYWAGSNQDKYSYNLLTLEELIKPLQTKEVLTQEIFDFLLKNRQTCFDNCVSSTFQYLGDLNWLNGDTISKVKSIIESGAASNLNTLELALRPIRFINGLLVHVFYAFVKNPKNSGLLSRAIASLSGIFSVLSPELVFELINLNLTGEHVRILEEIYRVVIESWPLRNESKFVNSIIGEFSHHISTLGFLQALEAYKEKFQGMSSYIATVREAKKFKLEEATTLNDALDEFLRESNITSENILDKFHSFQMRFQKIFSFLSQVEDVRKKLDQLIRSYKYSDVRTEELGDCIDELRKIYELKVSISTLSEEKLIKLKDEISNIGSPKSGRFFSSEGPQLIITAKGVLDDILNLKRQLLLLREKQEEKVSPSLFSCCCI